MDHALEEKELVEAVKNLIKVVKSERMGSQMMEITVCGSIAPYNHILGGKLVSILMFSPEVATYYRKKYAEAESFIASGKFCQAVVKDSRLTLLCTTSLYQNNPSQYNRIKVPCHLVGGKEGDHLVCQKLGTTSGYGTYHLSTTVTKAIHDYEKFRRHQIEETRKSGEDREVGAVVNYIFGEGISPRLRRLRTVLDKLGFNEHFFKHGSSRVVYGLALASNLEQVLLGQQKRPKYFLPMSKPELRTRQLAEFWRQRWLSVRIQSEQILDRLDEHQLSYPVKHGAQVVLPADEHSQSQPQLELWDDFT